MTNTETSKKIILRSIQVLIGTTLILNPSHAYAQVSFPSISNPQGFKFGGNQIALVITRIIPYIFAAAGLISFLFILLAGFQYLLSQGNPKQLEEARNKLIQAIIGFIIVFASYWVIQLAETILGVNILH